MRYDPATGKGECLGYSVDVEWDDHVDAQQGFASVQGSAFDEDGTLYLMGAHPYYVFEYPGLAAD